MKRIKPSTWLNLLKIQSFLITNFCNENMESLRINCQSDLTEKNDIIFISLAIIKEIPNNTSLWKFAVYHASITS